MLPIVVGDAKRLSIQQRRTVHGCQPLEHVYANWRYLRTVSVTWQKFSLISDGRVMGGKPINLRETPFIGELGKSVAISADLPRGQLHRPPSGCELLIVPQKCDDLLRFRSQRYTCLSIDNNIFKQLAEVSSSGHFFIRVIEDPVRDGVFCITFSEKIERASFDAFCVGKAASLPHSLSFCGAISHAAGMSTSPASTSVCVGVGHGEFSVAQGQLPLHGSQNVEGLDNPTFVVGPTAWKSIQSITNLVKDDLSVFVSVHYSGKYKQ